VRIGCSLDGAASGGAAGNVTAAAFATPSNTTVFVLMSTFDNARDVTLADARFGVVRATVAPHSIQTWEY
jgi:hypothetical protein